MEETKRSQDDSNSQATITMEDLMEKDPAEEADQGFGGNLRRSRTSISISSIRILTEEEVSRVKTKFHEEIDQVFVEAIRAHVSLNYYFLLTLSFCAEKYLGYEDPSLHLGCTGLVRF